MTKEETLAVINSIIDESTTCMKKKAEKLLDAQSWDFDTFGDRNTFARVVMEAIFEKEKNQYKANAMKADVSRKYRSLKLRLEYELAFIH